MLDGLLGRSAFYTKCKSLIKQTKTRIEVVKRKRNATQKFLRRDIADLLANHLESTAFSRADGLIAELILSSCYDFIDHVCELVLTHLSVLQKLRECPEDCREAVASLMFAAARFSDLPELRDLRDLFQERYGSSLEFYVNQKLVENITAKPPSVENKIQLLQDIASEFSVCWDSRSFLKRMSTTGATETKPQHTPPHVSKNKVETLPAVITVQKSLRDEPVHRYTEREVKGGHQFGSRTDGVPGRKDDLKHDIIPKSPVSSSNMNKPPSHKEAVIQKVDDRDISIQRREHLAGVRDTEKNSTHGRRIEHIDSQHKLDRQRQSHVPERDKQKPDPRPTTNVIDILSPVKRELPVDSQAKSMRKRQSDETDMAKSNIKGGLPPPYLKPKKNNHKTEDDHKEENDCLTFDTPSVGNRAEKLHTKVDSPNRQNGVGAREDGDGPRHFTEIYYKDERNVDFTPKRRSHRRKHSRSSSTQDVVDVSGEERILRRVSTSRRKHESRKGLQVVVADDDDFQKDEEEMLIDKLLLKYSKTPSSIEPGKSKRKSNASKSPLHKAVDRTILGEESAPTTSRSFSLPSSQVTEPKQEKVFTRAASFQPDTPAKHVHPKLPDYDDLAARFAALRAVKG